MRHSGNEKMLVTGLVRRRNAAVAQTFPLPAPVNDPYSGATLLVVFLAALIGVSLLLAMFARLWLSHYETRTAAAATQPPQRVAVLDREADLLQRRLLDLVSGSIEAKLQTIEKSIQQGRVTTADLQTLDELRQELRILANYSANSQAIAADPMLIRGGIPSASIAAPSPNSGGDELSFVRGLYYFSIVSVGVASLLAGGYWLHHVRRRRLPPGDFETRAALGRRRWTAPQD